ncbi:DMT family transporter [bacterium]|nr:DMT family transporter [bacterium]
MSSSDNTSNDFNALSAIAALSLCIMFGSNAIAIKISFSGFGVYFMSCIRFLIASLCLILWAFVTKQNLRVGKDRWLQLGIISISFSLQLLLFYTGLSMTTASRSALITNLQPFFVLFLAHFFIPGDNITLKKLMGIVLGFSGIALVFTDRAGVTESFRSGDIFVLCGAALWGCNAVYTKRVIKNFDAIQIALYPMIVSIPISMIGSYFFDDQLVYFVDATMVASIAYQSFFVAAFGYVAWNTLLKRYGAVSLHSFVFIMPITGVILGGLVLGEPLTGRLIAGLVFIVSGLLTIHIKQKSYPPVFPLGRNV